MASGPNLNSFPRYFKSEMSPLTKDSAFPPLKPEHRYRGVYERAGFDVNLGQLKDLKPGSRTNTMSSRVRSPASTLRGAFPYSSSLSESVRTEGRSSGNSGYKYGSRVDRMRNSSETSSSDTQTGPHYYKSPTSATFYAEPHISERHVQVSEDGTLYSDLLKGEADGFDPRRKKSQHRNLKNLRLDLDNATQKWDEPSVDQEVFASGSDSKCPGYAAENLNVEKDLSSQHTLHLSVATDELVIEDTIENSGLPSPPPTSGTLSFPAQETVFPKRLSGALYEFKKDVESHKNYVPKTPSTENTPTLKQDVVYAPPAIQVTEAPYPNKEFADSPNSYTNDAASRIQYDSPKGTDTQSGANFNPDYKELLATSGPSKDRNSQLSMVSSIISKDSMYQTDEEEAKELQRQLDQLKLGNMNVKTNVMGSANQPSNVNDEYASPTSVQRIESTPEDKFTENGSLYRDREESAEKSFDSGYSNVPSEEISDARSFPNVGPSNIDTSKDNDFNEEQEFEDLNKADIEIVNDFDEVDFNQSFEPVQPLAIHRVGQDSTNTIDSSGDFFKPQNQDFDHAMHLEDATTSKVDSRERIQDDTDNFEENSSCGAAHLASAIKPSRYPSGEGPCRVCRLVISKSATGNMKPIYSKTGELSGQWHRKCFTCSYENCGISFKKNVQCYALYDLPFCYQHYHELNNTLCQGCSGGIEGECLENELQQKWHLDCLKCNACNRSIRHDYYVINGTTYCEEDAMNITNGKAYYNDMEGNLKIGGLSQKDRIEKRRTRIMNAE